MGASAAILIEYFGGAAVAAEGAGAAGAFAGGTAAASAGVSGAAAAGAAASIAGTAAAGYGAYKLGTSKGAPQAGRPVTMPTLADADVQAARRRAVASQMSRRGRASTILTADEAGDKLGG